MKEPHWWALATLVIGALMAWALAAGPPEPPQHRATLEECTAACGVRGLALYERTRDRCECQP